MEMTRRVVRDRYASGTDGNGDAAHGAWKVEDDGDGQMGDEEWQSGMTGDVQQKAYAGEGCVLVIDAAGAGYRNLVRSPCLRCLGFPACRWLPPVRKLTPRRCHHG